MDQPWVILQELGNALTALLVSCLDITSNGVWRRNFEVGMSRCEEINELWIGDYGCRAIALGDPLCDVSTDIL